METEGDYIIMSLVGANFPTRTGVEYMSRLGAKAEFVTLDCRQPCNLCRPPSPLQGSEGRRQGWSVRIKDLAAAIDLRATHRLNFQQLELLDN